MTKSNSGINMNILLSHRYYLFLAALLCIACQDPLCSDHDTPNVSQIAATSSSHKQSPTTPPLVLPDQPPKPAQSMPQRVKAEWEKTGLIDVSYVSPGIAAVQEGRWVGNDHLLGVSENIGIVLEIVKPATLQSVLSDQAIKEQVSQILKIGHITPLIQIIGSSPLPYLHLLIMINPIENGYAAFIAVRLFEAIDLRRARLKLGTTFQAITWERQEFIVTPKDQLREEISKELKTMLDKFVEVYNIQAKERPSQRG